MTRNDDFRRLRALLNHKFVQHRPNGDIRNDERVTFEGMLAWLNQKPNRQLSTEQRTYVENRCCELELDGVTLR
jgi:hypothetical protein